MDVNQKEKPESLNTLKGVPLKEIVQVIKSFEYEKERRSFDDENKSSNQKSKVQIKNENLDFLFKKVVKIKSVVVNDKEKSKDEIRNLYKLLKSKLGEDLYVLNVKLLMHFFKGYKPSNHDKLNLSIQILFDEMFEEVHQLLKDKLAAKHLKSLENLFQEKNINFFLDQIIESVTNGDTSHNDETRRLSIFSNLYIYLVLKNRNNLDYINKMFEVEGVLAKQIHGFIVLLDKSKYLHKELAEALIDRKSKSKIETFIHRYLYDRNKYLKLEVESKTDQLKQKMITVNRLSEDKSKLEDEGKEKDNKLQQLDKELKEKDKQINDLSQELAETKLSLNHRVNDLERQLDAIRTGVQLKIQRGTKTALEDMGFIANELPEDQGEQLNDWINYLRGFFDSLNE